MTEPIHHTLIYQTQNHNSKTNRNDLNTLEKQKSQPQIHKKIADKKI